MGSQFCFLLIISRSDQEHFIVKRSRSLEPLREDEAQAVARDIYRFYIQGLQKRVPRLTFDQIESASSRAQSTMLMISFAVKGLAMYQVLFLLLPKPLSSMALDMVSILSMLITISGMSIDAADFRRFTSDTLLLISTPLAC